MDINELRELHRTIEQAHCVRHTRYYNLCADCRDARCEAWYAADCPPDITVGDDGRVWWRDPAGAARRFVERVTS